MNIYAVYQEKNLIADNLCFATQRSFPPHKDAIAKAKEQLEATIKELDLIMEDIITVDPKHHRHFVARRGEVLRQISDQYGGVTVSFPRAGVPSDKVWYSNP